MKFLILAITIMFLPVLIQASQAGDFTVNTQSIYAVPRDATKVLVLDLTLPEVPEGKTARMESIKIHSAGTATQSDFSRMIIWEDGNSPGWDGDEAERVIISAPPYFDTEIFGNFREYSATDPRQRIFVTLDTTSRGYSILEQSIKLELEANSIVFSDPDLNGPSDESIIGPERILSRDAPFPTVPVAPLAREPEAISDSVIRWHFLDLSNNELGFKILDSNSRVVAKSEQPDLSYLDETGLDPDTEYSGRRVLTFNDVGESLGTDTAIFSSIRTLVKEPSLKEEIQIKITGIWWQVNESIEELGNLLKQQVATVWIALWQFLSSLFVK